MKRCLTAVASGSAALAMTLAAALASSPEPDWGGVPGPTNGVTRVIGGYARGCLDGAVALPLDGVGYQVMRPSRDRFYGHPALIEFIRWLADAGRDHGWPGILVGDLAQARGGPMRSGHASHQTGLDVDIWFRPAPLDRLTLDERETISAASVVTGGRILDRQRWTDAHGGILRAAASHPEVARIFVNAAIKQQLCLNAGADRRWLAKIRPWWGHDDHFHVRLRCPPADGACTSQAPPPPGDGCDESLAWWLSDEARDELARRRAAAAQAPAKPMTLADLPDQCAAIFRGTSASEASAGAAR